MRIPDLEALIDAHESMALPEHEKALRALLLVAYNIRKAGFPSVDSKTLREETDIPDLYPNLFEIIYEHYVAADAPLVLLPNNESYSGLPPIMCFDRDHLLRVLWEMINYLERIPYNDN